MPANLEDLRLWALRTMADCPPDKLIGPPEDIYVERWYVVPKNFFANVMLHRFLRSDDDIPHDHPWDNRSIILDGKCIDWKIDFSGHLYPFPLTAGNCRERKATEAHRIEVVEGPVISLFTTGPVIREWGFHCPQGWRHWKEFVKLTDQGNERGRGCE